MYCVIYCSSLSYNEIDSLDNLLFEDLYYLQILQVHIVVYEYCLSQVLKHMIEYVLLSVCVCLFHVLLFDY